MVARVAAKLADPVAEGVRRIGGEDAIDSESVAGVRVDDLVSYDPHVFERQVQALRIVPHAGRFVGGVVDVDGVEAGGMHGC